MEIAEIKRRLARPATRLFAGGFRPSNEIDESWLGRVFLFRPEESIPVDETGAPMLPFAQFFLPNLPFCASQLENTRILTLFMSASLPNPLEEMGKNWLIREYGHNEAVLSKELSSPNSYLKPFPLRAELVVEDFPLWDGGGVPQDIETEILRLENEHEIEDYYDIVSHAYEHKFGGYPSFCQSGIDPGSDFEFVFQISSDAKIKLNVVDSGSLMFWRNSQKGEWRMYYDFY
jgi:uncharacterized protein YwqG